MKWVACLSFSGRYDLTIKVSWLSCTEVLFRPVRFGTISLYGGALATLVFSWEGCSGHENGVFLDKY